jgi:UDP-2-acetamido-3-amino-2,3-dideoxy-glucuronate N-acetyltransferase
LGKVSSEKRISLANHRKASPAKKYSNNGFFVHESSQVDDGVEIGVGTKIWHFSHVLTGSRVGKKCILGQNVVIGPDVIIGNGCRIQNNVSVYKGVRLEDEVFCGPSIVFTNVYNPRAHIRRMDELRPTLVKKGATLGANCTIVCGHIIGSYAFVGAGAVVTRDVPDYALMMGNPARQKGWVCSCGIPMVFNEDRATCQGCGNKYRKLENGTVKEF